LLYKDEADMKVVYYFLGGLFGLLGALAFLRAVEYLLAGHVNVVGILVSFVFVGVGALFFTKARKV